MNFPALLKYLTSFVCLFFFLHNLNAQQISPGKATPICDDQSIQTGAPEHSGHTQIGIPCGVGYSSPLSPYLDFYYVVIQSGTTFTFTVTPDAQDDYDFAAWLNPVWEDLAQTPFNRTRGSQNDPTLTGQYSIGLSLTATDLCEEGGSTGSPEPGMVKYFEVQPGDEILIAIDRWSETDQGYEIDFGGDAQLDCTILGNEFFKCASSDTQSIAFEESDILPELETSYPDNTFKIYTNQEDAEQGQGAEVSFPINVDYNNGEPTFIYVRVENESGVMFKVIEISLWLAHYPKLITDWLEMDPICANENGKAYIDLYQYTEAFLGDNPMEADLVFYANLAAYEAGDFITNGSSFLATDGQIILVEAVDYHSGCRSETYAKLQVNLEALPSLDLSEFDGLVICSEEDAIGDDALTSILVESGLSTEEYDFVWYRNEEVLDENGPDLEVTKGGHYSLTVYNVYGEGCENTEDFVIVAQQPPQFKIRKTRRDFERHNGIMVYDITGLGGSVFKLDDGDWQVPQAGNRLIFENVPPGLHWVYGKDIGGCGMTKHSIRILGYPDFFTPNGDGIHDTWNIDSLKDQPEAVIYIFDRYGKLLTQIKPNGIGWDGTYGGKNMPANAYWFKVKFKEKIYSSEGIEEINSEKTGHFLLVR